MGIAEVGVSHFSTSERKVLSAAFITCSRWFVSAQLPFRPRNFDREMACNFA
jgi:hypothetical protein